MLLKPDLILVDLRLPGMSGVEICKQLRAAHVGTPIIVLSALGDEIDKVLLLEIGADDYLVKPFGTRELLARIRAVLRRASPEARKVVHFSDVEVDLERRVVTRRGEELKLTPAEYNLLTYFLQNPDRPLTRDMILNSVWGYEFFPEHPHGGCARGQAAPETGAGAQRAAAFPDRARGRATGSCRKADVGYRASGRSIILAESFYSFFTACRPPGQSDGRKCTTRGATEAWKCPAVQS